jgi:hypothetical protein
LPEPCSLKESSGTHLRPAEEVGRSVSASTRFGTSIDETNVSYHDYCPFRSVSGNKVNGIITIAVGVRVVLVPHDQVVDIGKTEMKTTGPEVTRRHLQFHMGFAGFCRAEQA